MAGNGTGTHSCLSGYSDKAGQTLLLNLKSQGQRQNAPGIFRECRISTGSNQNFHKDFPRVFKFEKEFTQYLSSTPTTTNCLQFK